MYYRSRMNRSDPQKPAYIVESAENALQILLHLKNVGSLRVSEVSEELGVARSTAHRLLSTLTYMGFLRHDAVKRVYVPGNALIEVALSSTGHRELRRVAMPHLESLAKSIEWTLHLTVLEGTDIRFVDGAESPRPVRVTARIGSKFPAHSTSSGKVLLAEMSPKNVEALYTAQPQQVTEHTISSMEQLKVELELVAKQGYGTNFGENEIGLHAAAVPIRTQREGVIAAIAAARPVSAVHTTDVSATILELKRIAEVIAHQLDTGH